RNHDRRGCVERGWSAPRLKLLAAQLAPPAVDTARYLGSAPRLKLLAAQPLGSAHLQPERSGAAPRPPWYDPCRRLPARLGGATAPGPGACRSRRGGPRRPRAVSLSRA